MDIFLSSMNPRYSSLLTVATHSSASEKSKLMIQIRDSNRQKQRDSLSNRLLPLNQVRHQRLLRLKTSQQRRERRVKRRRKMRVKLPMRRASPLDTLIWLWSIQAARETLLLKH